MPEDVSKSIVALVLFLMLLVVIRIVAKALKIKYASVKTVKAVVTDKHKIESFSKYSGNGKQTKYVVVFTADGKKLSFYVSEFSYSGYKIKESGTLKYKGDRIIDFS